ncbi:MAG: AzlD domain-containing protein [Thermaerobacter sp.]
MSETGGTLGWAAMAVMAAASLLLRYSFIALEGRLSLPPLARRALSLLPAAVLPALVVPGVLAAGGALDLSPLTNPRIPAAAAAALAARRTGSMLVTLVVGMGVLLLLEAL